MWRSNRRPRYGTSMPQSRSRPPHQTAHSYRRDSSPPLSVRRGAAPSFPLSLTCVRERSADRRTVFGFGTLRCRVLLRSTPPPGAPLWRLPPWDRTSGSGHGSSHPALIQASFRRPFIRTASSHRRQPFIVRADGNPERPGPPVRVHRGAGATPAPPLRRLMMAPSHEQACRQYRVQSGPQD